MTSKRPIHEIQVGCIKAATRENQTASGLRHNVTPGRLYKGDDQWKDSTNFGRDDLLMVAKDPSKIIFPRIPSPLLPVRCQVGVCSQTSARHRAEDGFLRNSNPSAGDSPGGLDRQWR